MRLVLLLAALAVAAPSGAAATKASVRLTDHSPLTVVGMRFRAGERVTVSVATAGTSRSRVARASRTGSFTAVFSGLTYDVCSGLAVRATGTRGSVATLAIKPPPSCPVPPQPVDR